jgi:hypothetical protein
MQSVSGQNQEARKRVRGMRAKKLHQRSIRAEIRTRLYDEVPPELRRNLDKAERKLGAAKLREVELRDKQPVSCREDLQAVIRKAPVWLW